MQIACPNGHLNDPSNRFCDQCGAPLPAKATGEATAAPTAVASSAPVHTGSSSSILCPQCGQENLPGTAFCENCGTQLPPPSPAPAPVGGAIAQGQPSGATPSASTVVCPNCGYHNTADDRFCEQCGAALDGVKGTAPSSTGVEGKQPATEQATPSPATSSTPVPEHGSATVSAGSTPPVDDATASVGDGHGIPEQAEPSAHAPAAPSIPPPPAMTTSQMTEGASPRQQVQPAQTCPTCGAALPPNAKFCLECGTKIEQKPAMIRPTHCVNCGAELPPNAKFCLECGTKVEMIPAESGGAQSQPASAAPASTSQPAGTADSIGSLAGGVGQPSQPSPSAAPPVEAVIPSPGPASMPAVVPPPPPLPPVAPPPSPTPAATGGATSATPAPSAGAGGSGPRLVANDGTMLPLKQQQDLVVGREDPISGIHPDVDLTNQGGEAGGVSRRHATMHFQGGQWSIIDLDSTNYTRVNGNRIAPNTPTPLHDGDKVQFGRLQFEFKL